MADPRFDPNWLARANGGANLAFGYGDNVATSANPTEQDQQSINWADAFGGAAAGIQAARKNPDGTFTIVRTKPGSNSPKDGEIATVRPNADGSLGQVNWAPYQPDSNGKFFGQALATGALLGGGLAAGGFFGGAGAAGGAAGGAATSAGSGAVGGSGLTLGGTGASGAGLSATGGSGLTLAGTTGTGAGLTAGTGASTLGAGIGSTLPAVGTSAIGAGAAGATGAAGGASSLPSWLTGSNLSTAGKLLTLGGALGSAASGGGSAGVDTTASDALKKLGLEQADIARSLYTQGQADRAVFDPKFAAILDNTLQQMQQQGQRSDQLWNSYTANFLPNAEKFAQTALNYDTAGRRNEAEAAARGRVAVDAAAARDAQTRNLNRAGISLDAGTALALDRASRLTEAKMAGGAGDLARRNVEATGLQLNQAAAGLGQGIVGTSQQQAGQALQAGQAGSGVLATQQATRNAALAPSQVFYGGATSATGAAAGNANTQTSLNLQNEAQKNAGWAGLGSLAGTLLTAPKDSIVGGWLSDRKSKTVHGKVSGKKALATLGDAAVYDYTYKPGMGDGGRHVGRMAGKGDPKGADGMRRISAQDEVGLHHAAINELAKEVRTLNRAVTLADARKGA